MVETETEKLICKLEKIELLINEQNLLQKEMLTFNEASYYLDISHSNLYHKTHKREIPHFCPNGKKLYFKRSELEQWMQRNRKSSREELEIAAASYVLKNKSL